MLTYVCIAIVDETLLSNWCFVESLWYDELSSRGEEQKERSAVKLYVSLLFIVY